MGSFTGSAVISGNTIENIYPVQFLNESFNVGIQAQFCQSLSLNNNSFSNLIIGANLIFTNAII